MASLATDDAVVDDEVTKKLSNATIGDGEEVVKKKKKKKKKRVIATRK